MLLVEHRLNRIIDSKIIHKLAIHYTGWYKCQINSNNVSLSNSFDAHALIDISNTLQKV